MPRLFPLALVLFALGGLGATSPVPAHYQVLDGSRFWIDGTASTGVWTCEADAVSGHGRTDGGRDLEAELTVPVRDFDCGSRVMNRDLYRALRSDAHPAVSFVLQTATALNPTARAGAWVRVQAVGTLRLAGADRQITVVAEGRRYPDGRVALRGRHPLRMSDFGVRPPSHALGLVRAHDPIVARFDLVAAER